MLIDAVVELELRPLAEHVAISTHPSPWEQISRPPVMGEPTARVVETAFRHGGYVAGGFGRWCVASERSPLERGAYVATGGDIDLFFRSKAGWQGFLDELERHDDRDVLLSGFGVSRGSMAIDIHLRRRQGEHANNAQPTIQAIGCAFADPVTMLRSFDFLNVMVAMDADAMWQADARGDLEARRALGIANWASRGLPNRVRKYVAKHAYRVASDASDGRRLEQLCEAAARCGDEASAQRAADAWITCLQRVPADFFAPAVEDDILTTVVAASKHFGTLLLESARTRGVFSHDRDGSYRTHLTNLVKREDVERLKVLRAQRHELAERYDNALDEGMLPRAEAAYGSATDGSDGEPFSADRYCWAI